jgi:site-specific DNA recombinase
MAPVAEARKQSRCAIYTRKSTEHNLDLEFNSLDAQREACEAYIKSQAHEGWRLVPGDFNDGGISGASLDRPALQALISEIAAGKIDVVVVYKVDRLTRSLTDFAKLVDLFDKHGVSFVSITQSFNTTTSMGRLTLNVLLSFAQFEREVIGERVRDKIAASKRKGLWMGGPVPLGYASVNKKLVIVEDEAKTVRTIFKRYLELGSIQALAAALDSQGMRTKERAWSNDRTVGGGRFGTGPLAYLLKNRAYVGEVVHQNQIFQGDHAPIVDRDLFDAVQEKLKGGAVERKLKLKSSPSLLAGKIYDDRGNRMTPSHTLKKGIRYRYYVSQALLQNRDGVAGSVTRVPAAEIEMLVTDALRSLDRADDCSAQDGEWFQPQLERVVITSDAINLHIAGQHDEAEEGREGQVLTIPWTPRNVIVEKGISGSQASDDPSGGKTREALLTAIAKARVWVEELVADRTTILDIAKREGKGERHIRLLLPLGFIAPTIVEIIASGNSYSNFTITWLAQSAQLSWTKTSSAMRKGRLQRAIPGKPRYILKEFSNGIK